MIQDTGGVTAERKSDLLKNRTIGGALDVCRLKNLSYDEFSGAEPRLGSVKVKAGVEDIRIKDQRASFLRAAAFTHGKGLLSSCEIAVSPPMTKGSEKTRKETGKVQQLQGKGKRHIIRT